MNEITSPASSPSSKATAGTEHKGRIVVGVDGSASSIDALRYAVRAARAFGTTLEAMTVWTYPAGAELAMLAGWSPENDAHEILDAAVQEVFGNSRPSWLSTTTLSGPPARALIEESAGAEMLVLGSRGHGGFVGLLLGSVSSTCAEHARCPVLIVHPAA
jgi:nucleotide-binding universal stress UspA family protein